MRRFLWIIPLILMALAAMACDAPTYDSPKVVKLNADSQIPGKAYALVQGSFDPSLYTHTSVSQTYVTLDYGLHWTPGDYEWPTPDSLTINPYYFRGDNLWKTAGVPRIVWVYPRPMFRFFFSPVDSGSGGMDTPYFQIATMQPAYAVSAADPHVIYLSLGTEGVLVGPNPDDPGPNPRPWTITRAGLDKLPALPLTITDPFVILRIIALGLLIPPLSGLHILLLAQSYRYAFQPGEKWEPYKLAARVTAMITALAAAAILLWLTNEQFDYYGIVAGMTVICAALSMGGGVWISRKRGFSDKFTRRIALASGLLSLIVPIGVAGIWVLWAFIFAGVFAFLAYQITIRSYIERQNAIIGLWALDRMTLQIELVFFIMLVPVAVVAYVVLVALRLYNVVCFIPLCFLVMLPAVYAVYTYNQRQFSRLVLKKKSAGLDDTLEASPLFQGMRWWRRLLGSTMAWIVVTGIATVGTFIAQGWVYEWFKTLLIHRPG